MRRWGRRWRREFRSASSRTPCRIPTLDTSRMQWRAAHRQTQCKFAAAKACISTYAAPHLRCASPSGREGRPSCRRRSARNPDFRECKHIAGRPPSKGRIPQVDNLWRQVNLPRPAVALPPSLCELRRDKSGYGGAAFAHFATREGTGPAQPKLAPNSASEGWRPQCPPVGTKSPAGSSRLTICAARPDYLPLNLRSRTVAPWKCTSRPKPPRN